VRDPELTIEIVESLLDLRDYKKLRSLFKDKEIVDLAELFAPLETSQCIALFRLVSRDRRPKLLAYFDSDKQKEFVEELPAVIISPLLNDMDPHDRTKLLEELPEEIRNKLLSGLDPEERQVASKLLSYPEDSVGRLMTPDFLTLHAQMEVSDALKFIHWNTSFPSEYLHQLFVTDAESRLIGGVSLASLVVCDPPKTLIADIMKKNYIFLNPFDDASEAVEIFRKYDHHYIPVVDEQQKILGMVTADDLFEVAEEEATEDIQQFGGHSALEDSYFETPWLIMLRKRAGWLALLFTSGFFTVEVLRVYADTLAKWRFLTFFLPIIISAGGNSGTQAASLIIRALAINEMTLKDAWKVLSKEIVIGLSLGLILSSIAYVGVKAMGLDVPTLWVIICTIICVVLLGVIIGSMLPFVFMRIRLDPAVVSSPFITTLVDVTGSLIFINIAIFIFSLI